VAFNPSQTALDAARQAVVPLLLDDARRLAQSLAVAAGVKVGTIRSISDSAAISAAFLPVPAAAERNGDFSQLLAPYPVLAGNLTSLPSSAQYTFSLSVVFAAAE
jgi:uncharacterized protein YggE